MNTNYIKIVKQGHYFSLIAKINMAKEFLEQKIVKNGECEKADCPIFYSCVFVFLVVYIRV